MANFTGVDSLGFDSAANWQMVPEGGWRPIDLIEGAGLEVRVAPSGNTVVSLDEQMGSFGISRSFTLRAGTTTGNTTLIAGPKDAGPQGHGNPGGRASLDISVLKRGTQRLRFYRVKDQAGHAATRPDAAIEPMFRFAANLYSLAANVDLQRVGAIETIELPGNQGEVFWFRPPDVTLLKSKVQLPSADLHVFLMWSIEVDDPEIGGNVCGFCPKGARMCAIEDDDAHSPGITSGHTLAHELGHHFFLSHDLNNKENLLFFEAKNPATKLTKDQILEINRRAVGGAPAPAPDGAKFR